MTINNETLTQMQILGALMLISILLLIIVILMIEYMGKKRLNR